MKTLLQRTKPEHVAKMSIQLLNRLNTITTISEITIGEYIELHITFPEISAAFSHGDIYGFCESIFGSVYEN